MLSGKRNVATKNIKLTGTLQAQYTPGGDMCTMVLRSPSAWAGGACPLRRWLKNAVEHEK